MDIPNDIWECILTKIDNKETCENFFKALPFSTQKLLAPSYNLKLDYFKDIYILFIQSVLIVFKDHNIYCIKNFSSTIIHAQFSRYPKEIIIFLEDNDIFFYDYERDMCFDFIVEDKNILDKKNKIFFYQNFFKDENFLVTGNQNGLFYYKNSNGKQKTLYSTNKTGKKKFVFVINYIKTQFAYFVNHKYNGSSHYYMKLIDHSNDVTLYENNDIKITDMCFDERGNLFFCSDDEIWTLDENYKKKLFFYNRSIYKIDKLFVLNNYVYFAAHFKMDNETLIFTIDYIDWNGNSDNLQEYLLFELRDRVGHLNVHNNYLVIGTCNNLYFYDLQERKIRKNINLDYLIDKSNILDFIDLDKDTDLQYDLIIR